MRIPTSNSCVGVLTIFLVLFLFLFCGTAHATITGDSPNQSGQTIIAQDTVWDGENISLSSVYVNSTTFLNFTVCNSTVISTGGWILGNTSPINFTLDNSTITFSPPTNNSYSVYTGKINTTCGIAVPSTKATLGKSTLTFINSTVSGTQDIHSNGIRINTGCSEGFGTDPSYAYAKNTLIVNNLTLQYLGGLDSSSNPYYAICGKSPYTLSIENINSYPLSDQRSISFSEESIVEDLRLLYCEKGIGATPPIRVVNSSSYGGQCSFFGGYYYENITMNISTEGLYVPFDGGIVKNSWFDANQTKLNLMTCNNVTFENNTVLYASFNTGDSEYATQGNNNTIKNNIMRYTGATSRKNYTQVINNTFYRGNPTGGNIPLKIWGNYQYIDSNYFNEGDTGILIAPYGTYSQAGNNILKNNSISSAVNGISIGTSGKTSYNNTFINTSVTGSTTAIQVQSSTDQYFRDINITNSAIYDIWMKGLNTNISFINLRHTPSKTYVQGNDSFTPYYYLDVKTKENSTNISDVSVSVSGGAQPKNINYVNMSVFVTDENGRTPLPSDTENSGCIAGYTKNNSGSAIHSYTLTANKTGYADIILDNINPDITWYRPNPENSKYTIYIDFNKSQDLHFTGFSPSVSENEYVQGDNVTFQVWGSDDLTNIVWKVDGVEKQNSTSTTYSTVLGIAPITVDLTGSTDTETISKSWVIDPTQTIDPEPDPGILAPIANFTADVTNGTYPLKVSFTDTSENVPTNWYWDLDNDGVIDRTTQNVSNYPYKAKGNFTVKLTVSNANNTDFETKTAYIQVTGTSPTRRTYWTRFADWFNNFYQMFTIGG